MICAFSPSLWPPRLVFRLHVQNPLGLRRGQAYLKRPGGKEPARGVLISLRLHQREGEVAATAALHRLVDPDHGERLQQARLL